MFLRSMKLTNWRSYKNASFDFPRPHGEKNVILITAPNEYGKTSFFEAVILGLFGRDGLSLLPRARTVADGGGLAVGYGQFLNGILHRQATESGASECAVNLVWEAENGEPIEVSRTWHFRSDGTYKPNDDQLQIFEGSDRAPVAMPSAAVGDRDQWYSSWIAQTFIHHNLAEFFLFDGEQVQRYANREMSEQVRSGIEGLLGLPILRNLQESLAYYAQKKRSKAAKPADSTVKKVEAEIARVQEGLYEKEQERDSLDVDIPELERQFDDISQKLAGREGSVANMADLHKEEQRLRDEEDQAMEKLIALLSGDMALAVAGSLLRKTTLEQLKAEQKREDWEAGKNAGDQNLDRFGEDLSKRLNAFEPPLTAVAKEGVLEAARAAWEALWSPPPPGCATEYLHLPFKGVIRGQVIDRLEAIEKRSAAEVLDLNERRNVSGESAAAKKRERIDLEHAAPAHDTLVQDLKKNSDQLSECKSKRAAAARNIEALSSELSQHRAELARYLDAIDASAPGLSRAAAADKYAKLIAELLKEAVPSEVGAVAEEMTRMWKSMAHHADRISRIEISPDCEVRMIAHNGENVHSIDKSAGADQVFTQALIAAITKVSGKAFPFVVDTPLARLSTAQRLGVLRTFTDRPEQVIFLSTDEEVVNDKLDAIRNRIAVSYELRTDYNNGVPCTTVHDSGLGN